MSFKFRVPQYFANTIRREMGELYAALSIADMALAMVMLFEPMFFAAVYAWYVFLIPLGAKFASRFGYKHALVASIPFKVLYWLFLFGAQDNITYIYFAPLLFALEKSFFWPAFHALIARFSNHNQVGREFSIVQTIFNITHAFGPFIGGLIAEYYGVRVSFAAAAALYCCTMVPLLFRREIFIPKIYKWRDTWEMYKQYPKKMFGYFGFAEELLVLTVWPIFIFITVTDYRSTGLLVTLTTLIATVVGLYIGKLTDNRSKTGIVRISAIVYSLVWVAQAAVRNVVGVLGTDIFSRTAKSGVFIPLSAVTYERAEATHIMPYVVFFEQSLALGKFLAAVIGIILFALTGSFAVLFLFAALAALLYMLI
jgi:MFS transporter, DHA1 family, multidrug resistance protein